MKKIQNNESLFLSIGYIGGQKILVKMQQNIKIIADFIRKTN